MNTKGKGTRAEHKTIRLLESVGYRCTRAAASLGEFDIIAIGPRDIRLVQVKCNKNLSGVELERIELFPVPPMVTKELWRWDDYKRDPIIKVIGSPVKTVTATDWSATPERSRKRPGWNHKA